MGWFLTRSTSRAKSGGRDGKRRSARRSRGRASANRGGAWDPARAWRVGLAALWVGLGVAVTAGGWHGRAWLVGHVGEMRADALKREHGEDAVRIRLASTPAWFGEQRAERLCEATAEQLRTHERRGADGEPLLTPNPMDRRSLVAVRRSLRETGWFSAVRRVIREDGGRIIADTAFHRPVALVGSAAGYHLVALDRIDGEQRVIRLPGTYAYHEVSRMGLLPVTGAANPPPARPGTAWRGDDVAAGVMLAVRLSRESFAEQIVQIDVANYGGRRDRGRAHLMLKTRRGAIQWHKAPGREDPLEPSAETKIARLHHIDQRYGSIDADGEEVIVHLPDRIAIESAADGG